MSKVFPLSKEAPTEVVTHDVAPLTVNTDARAYSRLGWVIVLGGVGGFLLWASLAPLDKGVPLPGTVLMESNRQSVQFQPGGTIESILVKDGDVVKAGQVLVRMNNVTADSQAETSRAQYFSARAAEARLLAERDGRSTITFPPTLEKFRKDPRVQANMDNQQQLFVSSRAALQSELSGLDENIAGLRMQAKGLEESRDNMKEQLVFLKEQIAGMSDLAKDGYVARNRLLDIERTFAQVNGQMAEAVGNIGRTGRQILEAQMRQTQRREEFQKEIRTQLSDAQKEAEALDARVEGLDYELARTEVRAPVDGVVVGLNVFTNGGVVGAGVKMMDIVPTKDPMVIEGQLPVNLIDKVHAGLPVEMSFPAFNSNRTPHIAGVLVQVSADRTVDEKTNVPYYKVRARVSPEGAKMIAAKKLDIQSGMPVEMFVKTGERTMMSYLLKPVFDRSKSALAED